MDEIIERVGTFGRFQALLFSATCSTVIATVTSMMFMIYGNYNPGWICTNETLYQGTGTLALNVPTSVNNLTSGSNAEGNSVECDMWRKCSNVVYFPESSTIVTEWNLMCDNSWIPSLMITVQMVGVLVGSLVCGPIGDRFGRKVSLYGSVALMAVSNFICAFSSSWQMFTALRFFIGLGIGGSLTASFVYPMEFVGPWWRSVLGSVPQWSIGSIIFALIAYILKDWRYIHFAAFAIAAVNILPVFWIPESMRWLAVNGQVDKFKCVVQKIASFNKKEHVNPELINCKIKEIIDAHSKHTNTSYLDLFKTARLLKYTLKFGMTWILMALVYYAISFGIKSFSGNFYLNLVLFSLTEVPAMLCIGPLANRFGRRYTSVVLLTLASGCAFGIVVVHSIPGIDANTISIALATVSKMFIVAAWTVVYLFSTELYPTVVRNLHSGYLNALSRIGAMLSPFMVPADKTGTTTVYTLAGSLLLFSALLMWSVTESKGRPMTDTIDESKRRREKVITSEPIVPLNTFPTDEV